MASNDENKARELFNALRSGENGVRWWLVRSPFSDAQFNVVVSFESFMREVYFLQHQNFTVFDAKEAFHSSTAMSERFLSSRDFQYALVKIGRMRYSIGSDAQLSSMIVNDMNARRAADPEGTLFDSLRKQLVTPSVLDVLEAHLPRLLQSYHLYGRDNVLPSSSRSRLDDSSTITTDGFVDFLNAYFEYEEYFSFTEIEKFVWQMKQAFPITRDPPLEQNEMCFPHFIELFCRVASRFHVQVLEREGARLRRAVEASRLEFSIEMLFQHMSIKVMKDPDASVRKEEQPDEQRPVVTELQVEADLAKVSLSDPKVFEALVEEVHATINSFDRIAASKKSRRAQSLLFARLPPRKPQAETRPATATPRSMEKQLKDRPCVTLIRELITPPSLPTNILKKVEYAISYQNMGQYHMALGILGDCKARHKESRGKNPEDAEDQLFFTLMIASVLDSARRDLQALELYHEALKISELLPPHHPGRPLARSSVGCMLFYCGEVALARKCHQLVYDERRTTLTVGEEHIDTATAMNNLACCLSQSKDETDNSMEEAFMLLRTAARIYRDTFGVLHPRAAVILRNLEQVKASQQTIVIDAINAYERGEYAHVIPGSRFQINALVPVQKPATKTKGKKMKGAKKKK
ncbi:TPA: hypothetical protein N0F65_005180 [Lagenidium giganteum]|uniref:Uncharacterized protein n=1 Tax=Lagenidium giganteum TaxID=4803 RepID=A0AAV2Z3K2_9STRA|nr:TPA: hypothetical protein N0F65_005180 [Lagenidium giganteum]